MSLTRITPTGATLNTSPNVTPPLKIVCNAIAPNPTDVQHLLVRGANAQWQDNTGAGILPGLAVERADGMMLQTRACIMLLVMGAPVQTTVDNFAGSLAAHLRFCKVYPFLHRRVLMEIRQMPVLHARVVFHRCSSQRIRSKVRIPSLEVFCTTYCCSMY